MPQFEKKRVDDGQSSTAGEPAKCPKCGSAKTTIAGSILGRVWLRCGECGFNFSIDAEDRQ